MKFQNDKELYQVIGLNIKKHRESAGLTQVQLSEKLRISLSYLSKIEASGCDKSLSLSMLNHIANIFDLDISTFFEREVD